MPRKKRKSRADKLRDALENLARDELYDLLIELALNDKDLAHLILARYGPDMRDKKEYHRLVKDALRLGKGQHGFIDYWGATRAAKGVYELLYRADAYLTQGQPAQAIAIYQAVIESVVPEMGHVDDSTGEMSDCIHVALDGLYQAAGMLTPPARTELFDYCLAEAIKEVYADWDWRWDLAGIAAELVDTLKQRVALFNTLDQIAARREDEGWLAGYDLERAALFKLDIIHHQDDDASVRTFLEEHIQDERMRLELARFHLERGELAAARQVCETWLNLSKPQKPGLLPDFLALLLEVAELEGDHSEQIQLSEALFLGTGRFEYFERLKELISPAEWPAYRPGFLQRVQQQGRLWLIDIGEIYINEEMWPELLAYVRENPNTADHYYKYLAQRFPQEYSVVYEDLALATLEQKIYRKGYRIACT